MPVNFRLIGKELTHVIKSSESEVLIFMEEFLDVIDTVRSDLGAVKHYILLEKKKQGFKFYEALLENASDEALQVENDEKDIVILMHTAGTTGVPKGALLSHRAFIHTAVQLTIELKIEHDDMFLSCVTYFHIAATVMLAFFINGATNVVLRDFSPGETLRLIQDERVTWLLVVPTMLAFILQYFQKDKYDINTLKKIYYGGSPISSSLLKEIMNFFKCKLWNILGGTESAICTLLRPEDHMLDGSEEKNRRLQSSGRSSLLSYVKVVNESGQEVRPGEVGELIVKNDSCMSGYWKLPEETAHALRDGWYYTGDLAHVDEQGYVYLADRKKDMIISGGENVYPMEVEEVINSHPAVHMSAVIGVPDKDWGESVKAVVVLKDGSKLSEEELISYCKGRLASYKKPKSVEFVDSLPLTAVGKVLKKVLREKYWKGYERRVH